MLHKVRPCTRQEKEPPDVVMKIWSELRKRAKPIVIMLKCDFKKEVEDGLLLDGLKRVIL